MLYYVMGPGLAGSVGNFWVGESLWNSRLQAAHARVLRALAWYVLRLIGGVAPHW